MIGLALQWVGAILILLGFFIPHRARVVGRRCRYIGSTAYATLMQECWPGQHREMVIGLIVVVSGLALLLVGRRLAKHAGID